MPKRQRAERSRTRFSNKDKRIIAQYQGQVGIFGIICKRCGRSFPIDIMEVDHIVPVSKGGKDNPANLRLLCPTCNRKKSAKRAIPPRRSAFDWL